MVAAMDHLPYEPKTLREFAEADLRRAARLIIKVQGEIDPQFRISTPEGDYHLAVTLPADNDERRSILERVSAFMAWKQALGFTLASELIKPDGVYCLAVTAKDACACFSRIMRQPRPWTRQNFASVEWIGRAQIGQEMIDLLPRAPRPMTPKETAILHGWFGPEGRYPAVHLPTGQLRGI
jgi:hypothetical protein